MGFSPAEAASVSGRLIPSLIQPPLSGIGGCGTWAPPPGGCDRPPARRSSASSRTGRRFAAWTRPLTGSRTWSWSLNSPCHPCNDAGRPRRRPTMPATESTGNPSAVEGGGRFSSVAWCSAEVRLGLRNREEMRTLGDCAQRQRGNRRPEAGSRPSEHYPPTIRLLAVTIVEVHRQNLEAEVGIEPTLRLSPTLTSCASPKMLCQRRIDLEASSGGNRLPLPGVRGGRPLPWTSTAPEWRRVPRRP